jgi:quercetin dioxygenase-like cupin family protein
MPFIDTKQLTVKEPRPGWKGRFFHSNNMTFAYYTVRPGASVHEHFHPNEEVWNVIEGELEFTLDGQTQIARPGSAIVVPPNVAHSVRALSDARIIVVDFPLRESVGGVKID